MSRYPRSARACIDARRLILGASADADRAAQVLLQAAAIVARLPDRPNVALAATLAADLLTSAAGLMNDTGNQVRGLDRLLGTIAGGADDPTPPRPPAAPALPVPTQQEWWAQEMRDCTAYQQAAEIRRAA